MICLLQTYCYSRTHKKCQLTQFSETNDVTSYGSGWRKDVINQCMGFAFNVVLGVYMTIALEAR